MKTMVKTLSVILGVFFLVGCSSTCKKCTSAAPVEQTYVAPVAEAVAAPAAVVATPAPVAEEPVAEKVPVYVRK